MREDEFRDRLKGAIGEPPPLASPSYGPGTTARPRLYPAAMGVLAAALAVLLVLVLVGTRLSLTSRGNVGPVGKASPSSSPASPDSFPCALPVTLISEATVSGQDPVFVARYGFVNVPGGTFRVDPAASFDAPTPVSYSPQFKRWLPVSLRMMSPDGAAYAYVKLLPAGASYSTFSSSELHVVDIASNRDRKLWSRTEGIEVIAWQAAGILASTVPKEGGIRLLWLVDPASGAPARAPESSDPERLPLTATLSGVNYSYMGGLASPGPEDTLALPRAVAGRVVEPALGAAAPARGRCGRRVPSVVHGQQPQRLHSFGQGRAKLRLRRRPVLPERADQLVLGRLTGRADPDRPSVPRSDPGPDQAPRREWLVGSRRRRRGARCGIARHRRDVQPALLGRMERDDGADRGGVLRHPDRRDELQHGGRNPGQERTAAAGLILAAPIASRGSG